MLLVSLLAACRPGAGHDAPPPGRPEAPSDEPGEPVPAPEEPRIAYVPSPVPKEGGQNVGGGDPLKTRLFRAKIAASQLVLDVDPTESSRPARWLKKRQLELADDIARSAHVWVGKDFRREGDMVEEFCATTEFERVAPIYFRFDECDKRITNIFEAVETVIHESIHHLGETDEAFTESIVTYIAGAQEIDPDFAIPRRTAHTALMLGKRMFVWGGISDEMVGGGLGIPREGGLFDPYRLAWSGVRQLGSPVGGYGHSAVWTGEHVVIFGGRANAYAPAFTFLGGAINKGGLYDPVRNRWRSLSTTKAPSKRFGHSAVWTGREMLVWGGRVQTILVHPGVKGLSEQTTTPLGDGAIFDPTHNRWGRALADDEAPAPRSHHVAAWVGGEMIVWGGLGATDPLSAHYDQERHRYNLDGDEFLRDGAAYDPKTDTWRALPPPPATPLRRILQWHHPHGFAVGGNRLFIAGRGYDLLSYDGKSKEWHVTQIPNSNTLDDGYVDERSVPEWSVCWTGKKLALIATVFGFAGWTYDPADGSWQALERISEKNYDVSVRANGTLTCDENKLVVVQSMGEAIVYDFGAKRWTHTPLGNDRSSAVD